jgi:transposase
MWMRVDSPPLSASAARETSRSLARARAQTVEPFRLRDCPHCLEVAVRRCRKSGLYDVDLQPLELAGDAKLLVLRHRRSGRLLAVAQSGVEDEQAIGHIRLQKSKRPAAFASGPV